MDAGDIDILKFELDNFGNKLNLKEFVGELNIYESLFEPHIVATMSVADGAGLLDRITWAGSKVTITYTSNENVDPVTFVFVVDSVESAIPSQMDRVMSYLVKMYTEETVRAMSIAVAEIYNKMPPEKMIENVLRTKLNTTKPFDFHKTGMLDTINCSNLRPYQAIDKIKRRAVSRDKVSSSFVFYENQHGFNFKSIEQLLVSARNDPQVKEGDRNFYLDAVKHSGVQHTSWRQILAFERSKTQSYSEMLYAGGVAGRIYAYDINTGEHYLFKYEDRKNVSEFDINPKSVSYQRVAIDEVLKTGDTVGGVIVAPVTSVDDLERVRKEIYVSAFMSRLISNVVRMLIYGDSRITVGTAVTLNLPVIDGTTTKRTSDLAGGVYLISKVRHIIKPDGTYNQSCELIRTGMLE